MNEWYWASLLLAGGICLGFAMHALMLARQSRQRAYAWLTLLSLLEAGYCVASYGYSRELRAPIAMRWARAFCVFTPFITYIFAELVMELVGREGDRPRWFRIYQTVNLVATSAFSLQVALDAFLTKAIVLSGNLATDLSSRHRHRLSFTPLGQGWLGWVSLNFVVFAVVLFRGYRTRRHLLPIVVGCLAYFAATISDFGTVTSRYDMYYVQHFGFLVLVAGCYSVLARRYELSLLELRSAVGSLQAQAEAPSRDPPAGAPAEARWGGSAGCRRGPRDQQSRSGDHELRRAPQEADHRSPGASAFAVEIVHECTRVAGIVKALLSFARSDDNHLGGVTARDMIEDVVRLTRNAMTVQGVRLELDIEEDVPEIHDGAQRLKQVIMNLLTNACDALGARDPKRAGDKVVRIVAQKEEADGATWLVIEATDNADGIEPALLERIFDPFFTTKAPGRGTGLGLAISQELVAGYGGELTCRTARGEGTTFRLEIPVRLDVSQRSLPMGR